MAYSLPTLNAIESRIAELVEEFHGAGGGPSRAAWLAGHYGADPPAEIPDRDVVEDIVSGELNDGFIAMYRCSACDRLWLRDPVKNEWLSFRPERNRA